MNTRATTKVGEVPSEPFMSSSSPSHRPLIEQCTNRWQQDERSYEPEPPELLEQIWAVLTAPKFQRLFIGLFVATVLIAIIWNSYISTFLADHKATWEYLNMDGDPSKGDIFGANMRHDFTDLVHLADLDAVHLPRSSKTKTDESKKGKRIIFIGDIHGHMEELQTLLSKANYNPEKDHIVALGDMINKGPDSKGVVDFLMSHGASCVRGNHEDRILLLAKNTHALSNRPDDAATESEASIKDHTERALARSLTSNQIKWLNSCPVILRIGEIHPFGQIVAVHGGLLPGVALEQQDPTSVMNMRIIDVKTRVPSHKHSQENSVPWSEFWNKYERLLPSHQILSRRRRTQHTTVVYGHDARRGVRLESYTKGLDSGCGNGKALTAWIVSEYGKAKLVQVPNKSKGK